MNTDFIPFAFSVKHKEALCKKKLNEELTRHGFAKIESSLSPYPVYTYKNNIYIINFNYIKHRIFIYPVIENDDKTVFLPRPGVEESIVWKSTKLGVFMASHPKIFSRLNKKTLPVAVESKTKKVKKSRKEEGLPFYINRYMRTVSNRGLSLNEFYYTMTSTNDSPRLQRDYKNVLKTNISTNAELEYSQVFQDFTKVVDEIPYELLDNLNKWITLETE